MLRTSDNSPGPIPSGRITMMAIGIIVVCACLIYAIVAINTATELRQRSALDQNRATAQISARLLNEQWQDLLVVTDELLKHSTVESDMIHNNHSHLASELKYAVDLVPELMLAAVYTDHGDLISTYPPSPIAPRSATGSAWFDGVRRTRALYQSDSMRVQLPDQPLTEAIAVAVPVGAHKRPTGYMLALYRVGDIDRWLNDLDMEGSDLFIVNSRGQVVDASTNANRSKHLASFTAFRMAMTGSPGSLISHRFYEDSDADVGFAFAERPGWVVIVARPVTVALAPTRTIVARMTILGVLVLGLLATCTMLILRLYRTQDVMALALKSQNAQLLEADLVKSDFLANVSHDLRTPLAAMQLSISSLLEPEVAWEPEQARESLRVASDSLEQITGRVRNLLEMARIEAHVWPLNKLVCDLTDIVGAALERMKTLTAGRVLVLNFPEKPLLLECDPSQIETVIVNLLENATKYSPAGSPIALSGEEDAGWIKLSIKDRGPGVPPDEIDRVFDKFYRSSAHSFIGGTGLGLAICKSILDAHNGVLGARNIDTELTTTAPGATIDSAQLPAGAEFYFCLPSLNDRTE